MAKLSSQESNIANEIAPAIAEGVQNGTITNAATMKASITAAGVVASAALVSYFMKLHKLVKDKGIER